VMSVPLGLPVWRGEAPSSDTPPAHSSPCRPRSFHLRRTARDPCALPLVLYPLLFVPLQPEGYERFVSQRCVSPRHADTPVEPASSRPPHSCRFMRYPSDARHASVDRRAFPAAQSRVADGCVSVDVCYYVTMLARSCGVALALIATASGLYSDGVGLVGAADLCRDAHGGQHVDLYCSLRAFSAPARSFFYLARSSRRLRSLRLSYLRWPPITFVFLDSLCSFGYVVVCPLPSFKCSMVPAAGCLFICRIRCGGLSIGHSPPPYSASSALGVLGFCLLCLLSFLFLLFRGYKIILYLRT